MQVGRAANVAARNEAQRTPATGTHPGAPGRLNGSARPKILRGVVRAADCEASPSGFHRPAAPRTSHPLERKRCGPHGCALRALSTLTTGLRLAALGPPLQELDHGAG